MGGRRLGLQRLGLKGGEGKRCSRQATSAHLGACCVLDGPLPATVRGGRCENREVRESGGAINRPFHLCCVVIVAPELRITTAERWGNPIRPNEVLEHRDEGQL